MSEKDKANLLAMLDAISQILTYTQSADSPDDFFNNRLVFDATLMNFVVLGEMAARLSEPLRLRTPEVQWADIRAFRNLIAHEYLGIDAEEVWQIVKDDIPALQRSLHELLDSDPAN